MKLIDKVKKLRGAAVPIAVINGPDPQATMKPIFQEYGVAKKNGGGKMRAAVPVIQWDCVNGAIGWNIEGRRALANLVNGYVDDEGNINAETLTLIGNKTLPPVGALKLFLNLPSGSIVFFINAQNFISQPPVSQAVWNLRDEFKSNRRTLMMIGPAITLPPELKNDVIVLNEPLPTDQELEAIIKRTYADAGVELPKDLRKQVDAVAGLAAYPAEQSAAMAITPTGIDLDELGYQKREQVKNIPGAELYSGKETLKDVIGCKNIVSLYDQLLRNERERFRLVFFMDEAEKMVAGVGDTSGTSQAINGQFLTWSQDARALGVIQVGIPGAGKSLIAKAIANEYGLPCFMASLSKVKGSLVGESERNAAQLFKTADALAAGGRILMIATCNQVSALTPELQARFRIGTYFFDYPDAEQRAALWEFYRNRYQIKDSEIPESANWVGREIEATCELAYLLNVSLKQAAKRIVPVSIAKKSEMDELRSACSGRFVSADFDGLFKTTSVPAAVKSSGRAIELNA